MPSLITKEIDFEQARKDIKEQKENAKQNQAKDTELQEDGRVDESLTAKQVKLFEQDSLQGIMSKYKSVSAEKAAEETRNLDIAPWILVENQGSKDLNKFLTTASV